MKRLLTPYYQLDERLNQIQVYIDMTLSKNELLENLGSVLTNENDKKYIEYLKTLSTSTIQYNAVIISLYGCFENCAWYDDENECCALMTLAQKGGRNDETAEG